MDDFEQPTDWTISGLGQGSGVRFRVTEEEVHSGQRAGELYYDFSGVREGDHFVEMFHPAALGGCPRRFSGWVWGDGSGHHLKVRLVDRTGETHQFDVATLDWKGWREVEAELADGEPGVGRWGGDEDGQVDPPVRFESLVLEMKTPPPPSPSQGEGVRLPPSQGGIEGGMARKEGTIRLDDLFVACVGTPAELLALELNRARPGAPWYSGDDGQLLVTVRNPSGEMIETALHYEVMMGERTLTSGEARVSVAAQAAIEFMLPLVVREAGPVTIRLWPVAAGEAWSCQARFTLLDARNLLANGDLETDADGDGQPDGWQWMNLAAAREEHGVAHDEAHGGGTSLWIKDPSNWCAWSTGRIDVDPTEAYALSGWIKAESPGRQAGLQVAWFDGKDQWLGNSPEASGSGEPGTWQEVFTIVQPPPEAVRADVLCRRDGGVGVVWFDDLVFTPRPPPEERFALQLALPGGGNVLWGQGAFQATAQVWTLAGGPPELQLTAEITTPSGELVQRLSGSVQPGMVAPRTGFGGGQDHATERFQEHPIPLSVRGQGLYRLQATLSAGEVRRVAWLPFAVTASGGDFAAEPTSPFGLNAHLERYSAEGATALMRQMALAGAEWVRLEFPLDHVAEESFDWSHYDRLIETLSANGLSILGLFLGLGGRERDEPQLALETYVEGVGRVVERYHDHIKHWELWNEPNQERFWQGSLETFARLVKLGTQAVKAHDPEAQVVGGSTAGAPEPYLRRLLERLEPSDFDILAVHPCVGNRSPEAGDLLGELRRLRSLVDEWGGRGRTPPGGFPVPPGGGKPIWITALGWPTHPDGVQEWQQAAYLVRAHLLGQTLPTVEKVFTCDFRDDGPDPHNPEHHFGLLRADGSAKPALLAYLTLVRAWRGARFEQFVDFGAQRYGVAFTRGQEEGAILWADGRPGTVWLQAHAPVTAQDWWGNPLTLTRLGEHLIVPVDDRPVYVWGPPGGLASLTVGPVEAQVLLPGERLGLDDPLEAELKVTGAEFLPGGGEIEWTLARPVDYPDQEWSLSHQRRPSADPNVAPTVSLRVQKEKLPPEIEPGPYLLVARWTHADRPLLIASAPLRLVPSVDVADVHPGLDRGRPVVVLGLQNRSTTAQHVTVTVESPELTLEPTRLTTAEPLRPHSRHRAIFRVLDGVTDPDRPYPLICRITDRNGRTTSFSRTVNFRLVPRCEAIPIGGDLEEWSALPALVLNRPEQFEGAGWQGPEDLSVTARLAYNDAALYLAFDVTDDRFDQPFQGEKMGAGDSVRIGLDVDHDGASDFELGFSHTPAGDEVYAWHAPDEGSVGRWTDVPFATHTREGGMGYEIALPWAKLGGRQPHGSALGLAFLVSDSDGEGRKGGLRYFDGLGETKEAGLYGDVILGD